MIRARARSKMNYENLLKRGEEKMEKKSIAEDRFKIPEIKKFYEGNKTVIENFGKIADKLSREKDSILKFFLKKLATNGEVKGQRAVFTGRFNQEKLEETLKGYVNKYVICPNCGKPDTKLLKKGCHTFMKCMACGAENLVN